MAMVIPLPCYIGKYLFLVMAAIDLNEFLIILPNLHVNLYYTGHSVIYMRLRCMLFVLGELHMYEKRK